MLRRKDGTLFRRTERFLKEDSVYDKGNLLSVVQTILGKKERIMQLAMKHPTPFYVYDEAALDESVDRFTDAFRKEIPSFKAYYALKINHYFPIVKRVLKRGMGLDVGSVREIRIALKAGCEDIVYFSPGKTDDDITTTLEYADKIRIHIDSFNELGKLGAITNRQKRTIRAGVRIHVDFHNDWKKYGIQIMELAEKHIFFGFFPRWQFLLMQ